VTSGYGASCIFYMDGSLFKGCAGFAVHQMGVDGFGYKIPSPADVFTAELSALFTALRVRSRLCCLGKLRNRLTLWCMNVNNCAGACARTELM
jgi:hypothetical protein